MGWESAENVLCVRLDTLGDVIMTTPAIRALKESVPGRSITLLTSRVASEAAALVPEVDEVVAYEAPWMKACRRREDASLDQEMAASLGRRRFDAAVVFTVYSQNPLPAAMLCHLAGVPLRLAHCRENPYRLLSEWVPEPEPERLLRHEVRRQLDLVATVGCRAADERILLHVPEEALRDIDTLLAEARIGLAGAWAVVHVGASAPSRRYPPESFAQVVRGLAEAGVGSVMTGLHHERQLVDRVMGMAGVPCLSLAGQLDLSGLAGLLARAPLLVSNNSGPVHIAAGVGTPVVDVYALTNPQHRPWRVRNRVLYRDVDCRYCYKSACPLGHHLCMTGLPPAMVVDAACDLLLASRRPMTTVGATR